MSTYKKLLEEVYPDEASWADDYAVREKAMGRIDNLMSQWTQQHHKPFLDIRSKEFEDSAPPPQKLNLMPMRHGIRRRGWPNPVMSTCVRVCLAISPP